MNADIKTARSNPIDSIQVLVKNNHDIDSIGDDFGDEKALHQTNAEFKTLKPKFLKIKLSKKLYKGRNAFSSRLRSLR